MQKAELDRLLAQTAITLTPDEEPVFLEYFSEMKKMFDEFCEFPLQLHDHVVDEEKTLICFRDVEKFPPDPLLGNIQTERIVNRAIEVKSALGE